MKKTHTSKVIKTISDSPKNVEINLDLDILSASSIQGSALKTIIDEINEEDENQSSVKHSSHSSYTTHGTASW